VGISGRLKQARDNRDLKVPDTACCAGQLVKFLLDGCLPAFSEPPPPAGMNFLNLTEHGNKLFGRFGMTRRVRPSPDVLF
jgi:hypothetical protein